MSLLLLVLRSRIPAPISILGGNIGLTVGYMLLAVGTGRLFPDWSPRTLLHVGLLHIALFVAVYAAGARLELRSVVSSVMLMVFCGNLVGPFWQARQGKYPAAALLAVAVLGLVFAGSLLRLVLLSLGLPGGSTLQAEVIGVGIILVLTFSFGIVAVSGMMLRDRAKPLDARAGRRQMRDAAGRAAETEPSGEPWVLWRARRELITPQGQAVALTGGEYQVMLMLAEGGQEPVSRQMLNAAIGRGSDNPKDRSIDILISRLRRKCAEQGSTLPVMSVRGRGYVMHGECQSK